MEGYLSELKSANATPDPKIRDNVDLKIWDNADPKIRDNADPKIWDNGDPKQQDIAGIIGKIM